MPDDTRRKVRTRIEKPKGDTVEKLSETFLGGSIEDVYNQVLVPNILNGIVDMGTKALRLLLLGEKPTNRLMDNNSGTIYRNNVSTYVNSYGNSNRGYVNTPVKREPYYPSRRNFGLDDILFDTHEDCGEVLDYLYRDLDLYPSVSVARYLELCGQKSEHTDNKWGWRSLAGVSISKKPNGYTINMPPPIPI